MAFESIPAYSRFRGGRGQAYNEAAFRYFLEADRGRIERSGQWIILVLVSIRRGPGRCAPLTDAQASAIFAGLAASVREVDFVGWFRQGRVGGAVLPQTSYPSNEMRDLIAKRVVASLEKPLPAHRGRQLHVRVVCLSGKDQRDALQASPTNVC